MSADISCIKYLQLTADSTPRVYRCGNINIQRILKIRVFGTVHLGAGLSGQLQIITAQKFLLHSLVFFCAFSNKGHLGPIHVCCYCQYNFKLFLISVLNAHRIVSYTY